MTKGEYYARLALPALYRAAFEVAEKARAENRKIAYWEDGKVVFKIPTITAEDVAAAEAQKPRPEDRPPGRS